MLLTNLLMRIVEGFKLDGKGVKINKIIEFTEKQKSCLGSFRVEISDSGKNKVSYFMNFIQVGLKGKIVPAKPKLINSGNAVGIEFAVKDKAYKLLFNRSGQVGGNFKIMDKTDGKILKEGKFPLKIMP